MGLALELAKAGLEPEGGIAPPGPGELRELVRYRAKLVALRSGLKAQVHAVLAREGVAVPMSDLFGVAGRALLDTCSLGRAYATRVESLRDLIGLYDREIAMLEREVARRRRGLGRSGPARRGAGAGRGVRGRDRRRRSLLRRRQAVLLGGPDLTPRHRESDTTVRRGPITKQGRRLVRWAAIEAVSRQRGGTFLQADYHRIAERRSNRNIARVAAARKLLALVFYGLRDGEIRCLARAG